MWSARLRGSSARQPTTSDPTRGRNLHQSLQGRRARRWGRSLSGWGVTLQHYGIEAGAGFCLGVRHCSNLLREAGNVCGDHYPGAFVAERIPFITFAILALRSATERQENAIKASIASTAEGLVVSDVEPVYPYLRPRAVQQLSGVSQDSVATKAMPVKANCQF